MPRCSWCQHGLPMWGTGGSTTHTIQAMLKTEMKFMTAHYPWAKLHLPQVSCVPPHARWSSSPVFTPQTHFYDHDWWPNFHGIYKQSHCMLFNLLLSFMNDRFRITRWQLIKINSVSWPWCGYIMIKNREGKKGTWRLSVDHNNNL